MGKGLHHDPAENAHYFIGTVGYWNGFAPCSGFGKAEGVLAQDVGFDVVFGANDQCGEDARIGIDLLHGGAVVVSHSSFTPLRKWVDGIPKTKATLLLFCHSKVRVASGVINCPLALRTGDAV